MELLEFSHTAGGNMVIGFNTLENSLAVSIKSKQCLFNDPGIPFLDIFNKNTYRWARMFISAISVATKN